MKPISFLRKLLFLIVLVAQFATMNAQNAPVNCDGQFIVSHGSSNSSNSTTNVEKLTFTGNTITPNSFSLSPGGVGFNAMGINPIDGYIYAVRYPSSGAKPRLVKIGQGGTNVTDLGTINGTNNNEVSYAAGFDFSGNFYFTTDDNRLMLINDPVNSRNAAQVGSSNSVFASLADIAIDPTDGQMYGVSISSNSFLYKINKNTGTVSSGVGPNMGGSNFFASLFFTEDGTLYGYRSDGGFYRINKSTGAITSSGTGPSYTYADGCSCSFRVGHTIQPVVFCPTVPNPNPTNSLNITVNNSSGVGRTGLTYTLDISDASKRFRFTQSATTIAQNLFNAGLIPDNNTSRVTLSTVAPATGTDYNKIVVTGFQVPFGQSSYSFQLAVQLYTLGNYIPMTVQSVIAGLPSGLGGSDLSGNGSQPHAATLIDFCSGITLPVELTKFTATLNKSKVDLKWTTASEINVSHFVVEKSHDAKDFSDAGLVFAYGNSSQKTDYSFSDNISTTQNSVIYYRLRSVDIDGKTQYSDIRIIRISKQGEMATMVAYPNPATSELRLTVPSGWQGRPVLFEVFTQNGQRIKLKNSSSSNQTETIMINELPKGLYLVKATCGSDIAIQKVIKD